MTEHSEPNELESHSLDPEKVADLEPTDAESDNVRGGRCAVRDREVREVRTLTLTTC